MKFLFLILVVSVSCGLSKLDTSSQRRKQTDFYTVYKIDSINSYYLIYARKGDSLFKIVSKKQVVEDCSSIKEKGEYEFKLHSSLINRQIGGESILPQNSLLVYCFSYDDSTKICLERDSINDLSYADNVKGLCVLPPYRGIGY